MGVGTRIGQNGTKRTYVPVVDGDEDAAGSDDAEDGLEEGRGVSGEDADAAAAVPAQVVGEAAGAVGELGVRAPEHAAVGRDVEYGDGVGLDGGRPLQEEGRRQLVDVVAVLQSCRRSRTGR